MFRSRPFWFVLCVLLVAAFGLGLIILLVWWIRTCATTLIVTADRTILQVGLLSRDVQEVRNRDVTYIEVRQTLMERLMRVGTISASTSAQSGVEIEVAGIPTPDRVRDLINQGGRRDGGAPAR